MSYKVKNLDLDKQTVKSLLDLLDALLEVDEDDPNTSENEFTISDNNGGTIKLSVDRSGIERSMTIRRNGLKLTLTKTPKTKIIKRIIHVVPRNKGQG